jgi:hypothetical protein
MSFNADLNRFVIKVKSRTNAVHFSLATKVHESITVGSATTGAPGQPVDTGFLRNSWGLVRGATESSISTNVAYAPVIEHNLRSAYDAKGQQNDRTNPNGSSRRSVKSSVGGHHSVKLTVGGADRLQAEALREIGN